MKKLLFTLFLFVVAINFELIGKEIKYQNLNQQHGLCIELWGTSTAFNIHYLFLKKINKMNLFFQTDAIAGYRSESAGKTGVIHVYNFSVAGNLGYLHNSGRSLLLGFGLGQEEGRVVQGKLSSDDKTNKTVLTYIRLNYSRRLCNERLILGISLVYGIKIMNYQNGLNPTFNRRTLEKNNWLFPGVSIGYCFGKKYFQKEKIGTE
jgi:hypothetical protein